MNDIERYNFWHGEMDAFIKQNQNNIEKAISNVKNGIPILENEELEDLDKKEGAI